MREFINIVEGALGEAQSASQAANLHEQRMIGYHGTSREFGSFKPEKSATHPSKIGIWFTNKPEAAAHIAKQSRRSEDQPARVITANIILDSPACFETYSDFLEAYREAGDALRLRRKLKRAGYDGIEIMKSDTDGAGLRTDWAVFEPNQIEVLRSQYASLPGE